MAALLPCPFCGTFAAVLDGKSESVVVRCETCDAHSKRFYFDGENDGEIAVAEVDAESAWNRRV